MPSMSSASTDERRAAARHARLQRSRRIARLRYRVLAAALATFALAYGVIAFDGSMGSMAASSGSTAATSSAQTAQDDVPASDDGLSTTASGDTGSASAASTGSDSSSSDTLTTSQS